LHVRSSNKFGAKDSEILFASLQSTVIVLRPQPQNYEDVTSVARRR